MKLGTKVFLRHGDPLDFVNQADTVVKILAEYGYFPSYHLKLRTEEWSADNWGGYYMEAENGMHPFYSLEEIDKNAERIRSFWIRFVNHEDGRKIIFSYNTFLPTNSLFGEKAIWTLEFDDIDIHPSYAYEYSNVSELYKMGREKLPEHRRSYYYSMEEVLMVYNMIKKIYLEVGFEIAAGSSAGHELGYGEKHGRYEAFDHLLRFDRQGINRLIIPYEEERRITRSDLIKDTAKEHHPMKCIAEYDHPVPIIVQEPPYNLPEIRD